MSTADDRAGASPSHDPRTWLGGAAPSSTATKPPPSFDPKSWTETGPAAPTPAPKRRSLAAAALLAAVLAAGGGAAWLLSRQGAPAQPAAATREAPAASPASGPAPAPAGMETRTVTLAGVGELEAALVAMGVQAQDATAVARTASAQLGADGELRIDVALSGPSLQRLRARRADGGGVLLTRTAAGGFAAEALAAEVGTRIRVVPGELDADTFYSSAVAAGLNDALIPAFAQAFTFDFDFQRELKPGDRFEAVYEETVNADGEPTGARRLLYAALTTAAKSRAFYRWTPPGESEAGWFDGAGRSVVRSLMRTPVEGARVSSSFGMRTHPIKGYQKLHRGVDFAAPTGTPIYAAGDSMVEFAGPRGAAGNFVVLKHDSGWQTRYMHLNAFAPGLAAGQRVKQGQSIGEVGTTGGSTGPHLHYEIWIEGQPVDPMTIAVSEGRALSGEVLARFNKHRDEIDALRRQGL